MTYPVTIADWKRSQGSEDPLSRLLALLESLDPADPAWISVASASHIRNQWLTILSLKEGGHDLPLFGVPFAAKDNIDEDATVIQILRRAGAVVVGKTNLDAFATGLVGTRSPYGAVPSAFDSRYVSGGSSSGSASVVARGLIPFALGTDTAGSGRVPAGLNNIVGLKPTHGAISARGIVPACRSLDCVSILALTIEDAREVFDVATSYDSKDSYSRLKILQPQFTAKIPRIAICDNPPWFGQNIQSQAYLQSLRQAEKLEWSLEPASFSLLFALADFLYEGPWVAERFLAIKSFITKPNVVIDPVVRAIIELATNFSAIDQFEYEYMKVDLIRAIEAQFDGYDAILVPTTPIFPTLEEVHKEPFLENSRLGTYTNFVNFMDWSALSIPAGFRSDGLPFGVTLISTRWQEEKLLQLGTQWLCTAERRLGATQSSSREREHPRRCEVQRSPLVVVGAHLSGLPLNFQLTEAGATLRCVAKTSPSYRLYDLLVGNNNIKKPGLKRVFENQEKGQSIEIEIWNISNKGLGDVLASVPPPLAIGSVEIADGTWMKGFVCEAWGLQNALDISSFGGWRSYIKSLSTTRESVLTDDTNMNSKPLFESVLVANRGEIAVRIISTLKKLGIKSIAVYSQEDSKSQHVRVADVSFLLPGDTVASTYLSTEAIIGIAKASGTKAVIPGYGFLSESAEFAKDCEANGLVWIGPTPAQMRRLGLKHLARELAEECGVPLLPGTGLIADIETAVIEAGIIGYPVILKSSAGGGGIGLQQCADVGVLRDAFQSTRNLGESFFNDSSVFLEKFVEDARHIEVQIIGNGEGLVKHAGERDCSLQRRKQKVIEEGPAVFICEKARKEMRRAAIKLTSSVYYRGVGTVEFIYDLKDESFYFLEVNTRLQVEHPVTEAVTGLDLVEVMLRIAGNDSSSLFSTSTEYFPAHRVAIEARIYGESPLQAFRPSPGQLLHVSFPEDVRVDTWVAPGSVLSSSYDPLLAKLIVSGYDRAEAVRRLATALDTTQISGIETNLGYLREIVRSRHFQEGTYTTTSLDSFRFQLPVFEVVDPGPSTTIQDFPGRQGLWHVGIPPSGPMDDYAFRIANRILGNEVGAAALEFTHAGPTLMFHHDAHVAVVAHLATLQVDDIAVSSSCSISLRAGQTLQVGVIQQGCRGYLAVKGGINNPQVYGSYSTFALGKTGGHCGRPLEAGDMVPFEEKSNTAPQKALGSPTPILPAYPKSWIVRVMPGPHAFPEFFSKASFTEFFSKPWKVHYNSNRVGVRLTGRKPTWARDNGGAAGLHPSNIHDSPYSIGSISFTGDEAVILTCDGPSLGGFVAFATVISAEMWKIGQMKPGDDISLWPVTVGEALLLSQGITKSINEASPLPGCNFNGDIVDPLLGDVGSQDMKIVCRQAGDRALLLEFGNDDFDIRTSFRIYNIITAHEKDPIKGVVELSPGVRSLHVAYEPSIPQDKMVATLRATLTTLTSDAPLSIPSRTFSLPIVFEHSACLAAVERYSQTIRSEAPWLPDNIDFLRRINGLNTKEDVNNTILSTTYLVAGLGDVFFGSPCAVPLDPRHRLFGMKYNPSRSSTPEGTVGVGGQYLCIYGIDSPGGYQIVGRTVPIWNRWATKGHPWMFNLFDQIKFYPVSEQVLETARDGDKVEDLITVEDGFFDLHAYESWLDTHKADIAGVMQKRWRTLNESDAVAQALKPPPSSDPIAKEVDVIQSLQNSETGITLRAGVAGRCWKSDVKVDDIVEKGRVLFWVEAMKMEIKILAPVKAVCKAVLVNDGDVLTSESPMAQFEPL
ncbi:urea carboxylase [Amylocarpus encephaloides]|uniref:Urea carboxylase n=1 Tax=Amylocarpus encephaloides TaxID=45428 RepID=A0A9P8C663_9HELO|nr:urea carboxylase [Amylocarpus encephaloides]